MGCDQLLGRYLCGRGAEPNGLIMSIATGRGGTDYQALQLMTSLERVLLERDRIRAINDAKRQLIQGIDLDLISGSRSSLGRASSTRRVSLRLIHLGGRGVVQTPRLHNIGMTAKRVRRDRLRSEMSLAPPCAALLAPRGSAREASLVAVWASVRQASSAAARIPGPWRWHRADPQCRCGKGDAEHRIEIEALDHLLGGGIDPCPPRRDRRHGPGSSPTRVRASRFPGSTPLTSKNSACAR
jgi:hypothetical protein